MGQIRLVRDDRAGALPHLRLAADHPPTDPITLSTLAQCLMALAGPGQLNETEACLNQALTLGPQTDLAESDRQTHSRLARQVLRATSGVGPLSTDTQKVLTAETKQSSLFWEVSPLVSRVAWGVGWGC